MVCGWGWRLSTFVACRGVFLSVGAVVVVVAFGWLIGGVLVSTILLSGFDVMLFMVSFPSPFGCIVSFCVTSVLCTVVL